MKTKNIAILMLVASLTGLTSCVDDIDNLFGEKEPEIIICPVDTRLVGQWMITEIDGKPVTLEGATPTVYFHPDNNSFKGNCFPFDGEGKVAWESHFFLTIDPAGVEEIENGAFFYSEQYILCYCTYLEPTEEDLKNGLVRLTVKQGPRSDSDMGEVTVTLKNINITTY